MIVIITIPQHLQTNIVLSSKWRVYFSISVACMFKMHTVLYCLSDSILGPLLHHPKEKYNKQTKTKDFNIYELLNCCMAPSPGRPVYTVSLYFVFMIYEHNSLSISLCHFVIGQVRVIEAYLALYFKR